MMAISQRYGGGGQRDKANSKWNSFNCTASTPVCPTLICKLCGQEKGHVMEVHTPSRNIAQRAGKEEKYASRSDRADATNAR